MMAPTTPVDLDDAGFVRFLREHPNVVLDLWAPWCGPCKRISPVIDELAREYGGKVAVAKVNTDENPQTLTRYGIMGLPAVLVFRGGQRVDQISGFMPKPALKERFDRALGL